MSILISIFFSGYHGKTTDFAKSSPAETNLIFRSSPCFSIETSTTLSCHSQDFCRHKGILRSKFRHILFFGCFAVLTAHRHPVLTVQCTGKQTERPLPARHICHTPRSQCLRHSHIIGKSVPYCICKKHFTSRRKRPKSSKMRPIIMSRDHQISLVRTPGITTGCQLQSRVTPSADDR